MTLSLSEVSLCNRQPTPSRSRRTSTLTRRTRRRAVWLGLAGAALVAFGYLVWVTYDHQAVVAWLHAMPALPFFIAMVLLPAVGVPTTSLLILAGASFGVAGGLAISLSGLALNAALCFWLARRLRPSLERLFRRFETELPDVSEREEGMLRFVLGVKVAPGVPMAVKNYTLGMSGVSFRLYFLVTMLFTGVYAIALVVVGESLLTHQPSKAVIALVVLAVLAAAIVVFRRRKCRTSEPAAPRLETQPAR